MSEIATIEVQTGRTATKTLNIPLNRAEGDLEIRAELRNGVVVDAWSAGTMYRGIENILVGRSPLDGLVITPRICGICSTAHLTAAARALDAISRVEPSPDAVRIRNLALMTEQVQSDLRQSVLMFMVDFANPAYSGQPLYEEAVRRYEPLKGESVIEVIRHTKRVIEIIAILGGQWPHSSYMVPGGVVTIPNVGDLLACRHLLHGCRVWYERRILGCPLERWLEVRSGADLNAWLDESETHRDSDLGFFIRAARGLGLDQMGRGHGNYISVGGLDIPSDSAVRGRNAEARQLQPPGFARGTQVREFAPEHITEDVAHSWFVGDHSRHPHDGRTQPYATGGESHKYSWAKAPRYKGLPAETGPLAQMIMSGNPLFVDLLRSDGPSAFVRQLARIVRPAELMPAMAQWLAETTADGTFYVPVPEIIAGTGCGLTEATRGALGHWVRITDGKIRNYQVVTPTGWNGSPRDGEGVRGPWEEALIGTPVRDPSNPVELGHVVRSFDPCLVCTVHALRRGRRIGARSI